MSHAIDCDFLKVFFVKLLFLILKQQTENVYFDEFRVLFFESQLKDG